MTDIDALNAILVKLGGLSAYRYNIDAYNAWSVLQGGSGSYLYDMDALNAIDILNGGSGGHTYIIKALNSIDINAFSACMSVIGSCRYNLPWVCVFGSVSWVWFMVINVK